MKTLELTFDQSRVFNHREEKKRKVCGNFRRRIFLIIVPCFLRTCGRQVKCKRIYLNKNYKKKEEDKWTRERER